VDQVVYLDSSAILKLVFEAAETDALATLLRTRPTRVSSVLARVEVLRTAATVRDRAVLHHARTLLARMDLIRPDDRILNAAIAVEPPHVRSIDAIHLATALSLGHYLAGMVVYDRRLADAARHHGLIVWAPA
jgi:predicted nucleic acid-binding protein